MCQWTASLGGEEKQKTNVLALAQGRNYFLKSNDISNATQNHSADKCWLTCSVLIFTNQTANIPSCVFGFSLFMVSIYPHNKQKNPIFPLLCLVPASLTLRHSPSHGPFGLGTEISCVGRLESASVVFIVFQRK